MFIMASIKYSHRRCSIRKGVLRNASACKFIKKEALTPVFSCEICEIFNSTCFTEHLWMTASVALIHFVLGLMMLCSKNINILNCNI